MPISKLHSILAVANLLAHNNITTSCYEQETSLQLKHNAASKWASENLWGYHLFCGWQHHCQQNNCYLPKGVIIAFYGSWCWRALYSMAHGAVELCILWLMMLKSFVFYGLWCWRALYSMAHGAEELCILWLMVLKSFAFYGSWCWRALNFICCHHFNIRVKMTSTLYFIISQEVFLNQEEIRGARGLNSFPPNLNQPIECTMH